MAAVVFHHPKIPGDLNIRLAPIEIDWSYNLVTNVIDTYAGQVVQLLSINFDTLTVTGQFGFEGPWGSIRGNGQILRRTTPDWRTNNPIGIGLAQATAWFRQYFSIASQGTGKDQYPDNNYIEDPVTLTYQGNIGNIPVDADKKETLWKVYPINFPSWDRSQENFAPEWKIECQVFEAPADITTHERDRVIDRLNFGDRYSPNNPFSDPAGIFYQGTNQAKRDQLEKQALAVARQDAENLFDHYSEFISNVANADLTDLIEQNASVPSNVAPKAQKSGLQRGQDRLKESRSRRRLTDDALRVINAD